MRTMLQVPSPSDERQPPEANQTRHANTIVPRTRRAATAAAGAEPETFPLACLLSFSKKAIQSQHTPATTSPVVAVFNLRPTGPARSRSGPVPRLPLLGLQSSLSKARRSTAWLVRTNARARERLDLKSSTKAGTLLCPTSLRTMLMQNGDPTRKGCAKRNRDDPDGFAQTPPPKRGPNRDDRKQDSRKELHGGNECEQRGSWPMICRVRRPASAAATSAGGAR